jgi:hypothetical protein
MWQKLLAFSRLAKKNSLVLIALLASFSQAQAAASVGNNNIIIGGSNTSVNGVYYTKSANSSATKGAFTAVTTLGNFDRGTGRLLLSAQATTIQSGQDNFQTAQLFYRIYAANTTAPAYTVVNLDVSTISPGSGANSIKTWTASASPANLLSATSAGNYTLDLYFQFVSTNNRGIATNYFDRTSDIPYRTRFAVQGAAAATWVGGSNGSSDWFTPSNWSGNVVPDSTTDVTIALPGNLSVYPTISGTGGKPAKVRTLRLDKIIDPNSSVNGVPVLNLVSGELRVYGDFQNPNNALRQIAGIFTLAGTTQAFDGAEFTSFRIQGGGTKTLRSRMLVKTKLEFSGTGGTLVTRTDNDVLYSVDLDRPAFVTGETETSYVLGVLRATSYEITRGSTPYTFGDIGITLTSSSASSTDYGATTVTRRTGVVYTGAGPNETSTSIKRSFAFSTFDNPTNQVYSLSFKYLNNELDGKSASTLGIYRSANGTAPFDNLNRASNNIGDKTVVSNTVTGTLAATFTLGASAIPLPVTLVSFTATSTPQGGALLRWATATETNNKGFGIERQLTSSDSWQSVGYLASGNNTTGGTYEYLDKSLSNATFSPQAYYRLRQEDQDGKVSYSPVAVVSRSAMAASSELLLSPVPVTGSNISLTFAEAGQAGSEITITNTQGQRLFSQTTQASADAALSLPVERLAAGVYIVSVRVPGQAVRHARFVKL